MLGTAPSDGLLEPLANDTILRGYELSFQERRADELVYTGRRDEKLYLIRQSASAQSSRLAWECALLQRLSHSLLPEFVDYFEEGDATFLVTRLWLSHLGESTQKPENIVMSWGTQLFNLLAYLGQNKVHLDLHPQNVVYLNGGQLRLLEIRSCERTLGHPHLQPDPHPARTDQMALGKCLAQWLGEPLPASVKPKTRALLHSILGGEFTGSTQDLYFLSLPNESGELVESLGRIPVSADSERTCLSPGTRLGGYEMQFLAEGGMSVCYLGRADHQIRFIKEVPLDDAKGASALRREYEFLRVLRHPNIVTAHQAFEQAGYLYLVMDYVEGTSLETLSSRPDYINPPERQLLQWGLSLCQVLHYLHTSDPPVIYRDLKPGNIIMTNQGQLRLIDFGIARTWKAGHDKDTQAMGTISTASPEHFYGQTDHRSDIYTLGATLFLLVYPEYRPKVPFQWTALRELNSRYSQEFSDMLARCLNPDPDLRWEDAHVLAAEIQRQLDAKMDSSDDKPKLQVVDIRSIIEEVRHISDMVALVGVYTRKLAAQLKQPRVEMSPTLRAFGEGCEVESLGRVFSTVAEQLERGSIPSSAFGLFPNVFPAGYLEIIGPANSAASLATALEKAATFMEEEDLRSRTRSVVVTTDPIPSVQKERKTRVQLGAVAALAVGSGAVTAYRLHSQEAPWIGAGVAVSVGVFAVAIAAVRDTRMLRVQKDAQNLMDEAWTSYAKGETDKAASELSSALTAARDGLGPSHLTTLSSLHSLANLYRQKQDYNKAETYYQQAVGIYRSALPLTHPARGQLHFDRAQNFAGLGDLKHAHEELDTSLNVWRANRQSHALELSEVQFFKGRLHFDHEEDEAALKFLGESLEIQHEQLGLKSPLVYTTMSYLTRAYVRQGRLKESEPHLARLIREVEQESEPDYTTLAEANLDMGRLRLEESRPREAEPYFLRCLQLLQSYVGPNEWLLERALRSLRACYPAKGDQARVVHLVLAFLKERQIVRPMLDKYPELIHARDNTGWGPLQWAVFIGREDVLLLLTQRGADAGYDGSRGLGPVHVACAWNRPTALKLLLERHPDLNAKGLHGWTPLFWCAFTGQQKLMEMLLDRGADVRGRDDQGRTLLHLAATRNHIKMVAALLSAGSTVNSQDDILGSTPLHIAAERGHLAICECLVFNGANISIKDKAGRSPLDLAVKNQHKLVARELRKLGRKLKVPSSFNPFG